MPIYDYRCDACGHAFSAVQSYTDATLEECPQCGARPRKVLTSPAIVFKGSGWYKTDSRRGSDDAKADAKAEGRSEPKPDAKAEGRSESKADEKAGGKSESKADTGADKGSKAVESKADARSGSRSEPKAEPKSETKKKEPAS